MTIMQLMTGSPNVAYDATGTLGHIVDGALTVRQTTAPPAWTGIGSVYISNGSINVDVQVSDYISIIGSPNYNLPVTGSVQLLPGGYTNIIGSPNYSLPVIGSVQVSSIVGALPAGTNTLGSVYVRFPESLPSGTALLGSVKATPDGYYQMLGSPNYNFPVRGSVEISNNINVQITTDDYISIVGSPSYVLPVIGSVQVSSITGALPAGTALLGSVVADVVKVGSLMTGILGSVNVSSITGALPTGTNSIGNIGSIGAGILGSVQVSSLVGALPAGTALIGSVNVRISDTPPAWTGTGSTIDTRLARTGSSLTFAWVGALTGSVIGIPPTGSRYDITSIVMSASGQGATTLFVNSDTNANRIAKAYLSNFGGFVSNYGAAPFQLPINGSLMITTAATGFTPIGDVTVDFRMSA